MHVGRLSVGYDGYTTRAEGYHAGNENHCWRLRPSWAFDFSTETQTASHVLVYESKSWGALLAKITVYSHTIVWKPCFHLFIILRQLGDSFIADLEVLQATSRSLSSAFALSRYIMSPKILGYSLSLLPSQFKNALQTYLANGAVKVGG